MNVFEFLGLSQDYRKEGKVVQLVKNFEEVPESKIGYPLMGQVKYDGVFGMLVVTGEKISIFGRTGKRLSNLESLCYEYNKLPAGVYIGEICLPGKSLETLSGIVNPNRTKALEPELEEYFENNREIQFHDYLTISELLAGKSAKNYTYRVGCLSSNGVTPIPYRILPSESAVDEFAREAISQGEEGIVLKQDLDWLAGHKGFRSMKKVRRVRYDLLCVGKEEGKGKYTGKVANLLFQWKEGDTLKAMLGKNYTHQDATDMFKGCLEPVGKIFTVYGLQDSSKGKIRLPKVGELRHDKHEPDL